MALAGTASASEFGIVPGSFSAAELSSEGGPEYRAGAHPDELTVEFALHEEGTTARDLAFALPPGLQGNPEAVPDCSRELVDHEEECPADTQVGTVAFGGSMGSTLPIFKLEPLPGQVMAFTSKPPFQLSFASEVRPDDFGVTLAITDIPHQAVGGGKVTLWGVPADHQVGTSIPRRPFLTNPTGCDTMRFGLRARSWEEGAPWLEASSETPPLEGCRELGFAPTVTAQLGTPVADSPTGVRVRLDAPQEEDASERGEAQIEDVDIAMPPGIGISPGTASSLAACSDEQVGLGDGDEAHCPPASRVGGVVLSSAMTVEPSNGAIYLGQERPGERLRIFVVVPGSDATIKLAGALTIDPATGLMSTALHDLPAVGLQQIDLSFDGGSRALLATPLSCGPTSLNARFRSPGGLQVESKAPLSIAPRTPGAACTGSPPFAPTLAVARSSLRAGRPTALAVRIGRGDGEQLPARFSFSLPAGLSMALGSVQPCSEAEVSAGACPEASRIGTAAGTVGSGLSLASLAGGAYLTGPYRRAPFGVAIVMPAKIGPFDLGRFVLRSALALNGKTGAVSLLSDQIPDTIEGIPVRFRTIDLSLDRGGLLSNPTGCRPSSVGGVIEAHSGATSAVSIPFPVNGCHRLGFGFHPHLSVDARRGPQHSVLRVSARLQPRGSSLASLQLVLPRGLKLDPAAVGEICSRPDADAGLCPPGARVGLASARSPAISKRLRGPIFVVRPQDDGEPDLALGLRSGGLRVDMRGQTHRRDGRLVAELSGLPDMPLRAFSMTLGNAKTGGVSFGASLCHRDGAPLRASILAVAHNGRVRRLNPPIGVEPGCRPGAGSGGDDAPAPHHPGGTR